MRETLPGGLVDDGVSGPDDGVAREEGPGWGGVEDPGCSGQRSRQAQ